MSIIICIIGVKVHEYMRKEMMGKWIALLTCIINLKGNISAFWKNNPNVKNKYHIKFKSKYRTDRLNKY